MTGSFDLTARVWDSATGEMIEELPDHRGAFRCSELSEDGSILAVAIGNTVQVLDTISGERLFTLDGIEEDINDIEIRHDTKWQLSALRRFLSAKAELFEEYNLE